MNTPFRRLVDLRLYLVLGPDDCAGRDPAEIAAAAVDGGVTLVQLRAKTTPTRELLYHAQALREVLAERDVPLLINDRVDIALAAGADGVHLGQDDMPVGAARRLLGPEAVIGLTVRTPAEAETAVLELVDYLSIGGVFATRSKHNPDPPIGLRGLAGIVASLRRRSDLPLCAIAGIDAGNAAAVLGAGVDGIAVISAIGAAADPAQAARELRALIHDRSRP